jgi:hypothetical protein
MSIASTGPRLVSLSKRENATEFDIDVEKRTVSVRFAKKVSVMDIRIYAERLRAHPEFNREFSEVVDLREVEDLELKAPDFLQLADEIDCFSAGSWRAFVVHNSIQNHAARMHKILRFEGNVRIFSSLEDAQAWIDSRPRLIR